MPEDGGLIDQALIGLKPVNAWVHTYTKPQTSSTRSRGLGWRIHESVEDTKLSTNKQHTLSTSPCCPHPLACPAQQVWLPGNDIQDPTTWDGSPPMHAQALARGPLAPSKPHPNPRRRPLAAAQPPTRAHTRSLQQAPRTIAMASSSYHSSTAFIWHSSRGRGSPSIGRPSRSCVSGTPRGAAPASPATEIQGHCPRLHPARGDEQPRGSRPTTQKPAARELFWKPLSWLGAIRPTSANDAFDPLGLEVPILTALPRLHNSPLAKFGCKKFCMDFHGDHTSTCTAHSGRTTGW